MAFGFGMAVLPLDEARGSATATLPWRRLRRVSAAEEPPPKAVLQVLAFAVGGWSGYRPRGVEASAIFSSDPGRIELGALIGGSYGLVFLVIFVGTVAAVVRRSEGGARLADIALGGGLIVVVALAIGYRSLNAAAFQANGDDQINPEIATVMFRLYTSSLAGFVSFGLAAFVGATGLAALHGGVLPTWLGWMSVVSAVGLMTPAHWVFEGLALIWIVVVSYLLFRSDARVERSPRDPIG